MIGGITQYQESFKLGETPVTKHGCHGNLQNINHTVGEPQNKNAQKLEKNDGNVEIKSKRNCLMKSKQTVP